MEAFKIEGQKPEASIEQNNVDEVQPEKGEEPIPEANDAAIAVKKLEEAEDVWNPDSVLLQGLNIKSINRTLTSPNRKFAAILSENRQNLDIWDLKNKKITKNYSYDRNKWQSLQCSSESKLGSSDCQYFYYGSAHAKQSYRLNL